MSEIIKLGISSCLLGNDVRYDGENKLDQHLIDTFGRFVEWVPICPEVEAGLPVPREPMQLVADGSRTRLITIKTQQDQTDIFVRWIENKLKHLEQEGVRGFILKARSPSCGIRDAELFSMKGESISARAGLFAEAVMGCIPSLPVEDEGRLQDPGIRENFIERVFVYHRWQDLVATKGKLGELVAFHAEHKLMLMAHSPKHLRELGVLVSQGKKYQRTILFEEYFRILMDGLRLMATVKKHTNVLQHMAGYFKKRLSLDEKQELLDVISQYHKGLVPLIVPVTLIRHYVRKHDEPYLAKQYYLNPHPLELMRRTHV